MKRFIATLFLAFLIIPTFAQSERYFSVGVSGFQEDVGFAVGEGAGFRLGAGMNLNKTFGFEATLDVAPATEEDAVASYFEDQFGVTFESYDIDPKRNVYLSIFGTLTYPLNNSVSIFGKVGYASYWTEVEGEITSSAHHHHDSETEDISSKTRGNDTVASVGLLFPFHKRSAMELSVTQHFGDAEALSVNGTLRFKF